MTKDIAVSQRAREAAADLIDQYWSGSDDAMRKLAASIRAGHRHGAFVRAFARFEAEIRAEVWERAAKVADAFAGYIGDQASHPKPLPIDTNEGWRRVRDGALDIAQSIRNQKDHDHE